MAVAGQLELQRLGADRVESAEYPVLTAEPGLDFLHQMQGPLVLAANEVALCGGFKPGHPCLGISAHELRAVNVQGEQYAGRKLLEAGIALQRLDRITRGIQIPRQSIRTIHHGIVHQARLVATGIRNGGRLGRYRPEHDQKNQTRNRPPSHQPFPLAAMTTRALRSDRQSPGARDGQNARPRPRPGQYATLHHPAKRGDSWNCTTYSARPSPLGSSRLILCPMRSWRRSWTRRALRRAAGTGRAGAWSSFATRPRNARRLV